jgi:uncharacterized membrane protein YfcA
VTTGLIAAALAVVAFLYASVGHAGASGYIAVMALADLPAQQIKPLALLLNTVVASVGCWNFLRAGHLPCRRIWPVYLLAIPGAFLGGWLNLPSFWFRRLVGLVLLVSAWRLGRNLKDPPELQEPSPALLLVAGGGLGVLAGLTGTGGGVFLTPLLLFCRWCTTRQAAAVSVLFILFNSIAGLMGLAVSRGGRCGVWRGLSWGYGWWWFWWRAVSGRGWAVAIGLWPGSVALSRWCWCWLPGNCWGSERLVRSVIHPDKPSLHAGRRSPRSASVSRCSGRFVAARAASACAAVNGDRCCSAATA